MGFYKLRSLRQAVGAPGMLPASLPPTVLPVVNGRIERFLDGFQSPQELAANDAPALPVEIPKTEILHLRKRWLVLIESVCGTDRETLRLGKERVRDLFKRLFKAS